MQNVDDTNFTSEVLSPTGPVLVRLTAKWCSPCKVMAPQFAQAEQMIGGGKIRFVEIDIDRSPTCYTRLGSPSIPTMVLFNGRREVGRRTGAMSAPAIIDFVTRTLTGG